MISLFDTDVAQSSSYHPQTNGMVEQYNKTLGKTLVKNIGDSTSWATMLQHVVQAINSLNFNRCNFGPFRVNTHFFFKVETVDLKFFQVFFGRDPNLIWSNVVRKKIELDLKLDLTDHWLEQIQPPETHLEDMKQYLQEIDTDNTYEVLK
jgi:hypothetical protein